MLEKRIKGFLHYRTDLGDGIRTGVVFSECNDWCSHICDFFRFFPDHDFCEDTAEQSEYTAEQLVSYLREEKTLYYAGKLGITFLGREPLRDPLFCADVARGLKESGIPLQVYTCGMCSSSAFECMEGLVELYVLRVFLPLFSTTSPGSTDRGAQVRCAMEILESQKTPYRILVPITNGVMPEDARVLAEFLLTLRYLKSVILDFSASDATEDLKLEFRQIFLKKKIPLY